jgi:hypothetical protein
MPSSFQAAIPELPACHRRLPAHPGILRNPGLAGSAPAKVPQAHDPEQAPLSVREKSLRICVRGFTGASHLLRVRGKRMRPLTLRSQCAQRLTGIPVPQPFDLTVFAAALARHRGRPLRVLRLPDLDKSGISGAWVSTDTTDYLVLDADASKWHQDLIALHEFGHVLCEHGADADWLHGTARSLVPDLGDEAIRKALGRHGYSALEEREAELTATLIMERAEADPVSASAPGQDGVTGRLAHALRHPVRHV